MTAVSRASVAEALGAVYDPCSVASRSPLNVFEMGLVRDWDVREDGTVHVTLSPTSPSCVLIGSIMQGVEQRVSAVAGVRDVVVDLDAETFWTPDLMTEDGRRKLDAVRETSRRQVPVRPRQWQEGLAARR
jgi:metal-sulfur cluster biosynthetic enzyme